MSIVLKEYQGAAVNFLVDRLNTELNNGTKKTIVFKSPTGSGKTIMAGSIINDLAQTNPNITFIWTSVADGKLHTQSAEKIREFYPEIPVSLLDNVHFGVPMSPGSMYVVSWQKLWSKDNVFMREGENFNFSDLLGNTKKAGTKIILIVDESHLGSGKDTNIQKVKDLIDADATLNLSATPKTEVDYEVGFEDVIAEGVIKKDIYVNKDINAYIDKDELSRVLHTAMDKRDELARLYPNDINPLCIIQLPNGMDKLKEVEYILGLRGKTDENGKLAVWMSKRKSDTLGTITELDSTVEYLLFKSAVATGWDCTRAHVLVKLRDVKSNSFEIQTVGRILRMPEKKHYKNDILNSAYIYSDLDSFEFEAGAFLEKDIKSEKAELVEEFHEQIELPAFYRNRVQLSRIAPKIFGAIMYRILDKHKEQIQFDVSNITGTILQEVHLSLGDVGEEITNMKTTNTISSPHVVDSICRGLVKGITNVPNNKEAVNNVLVAIIKWIADDRGWNYLVAAFECQKIILNQTDQFKVFIYEAIEIYDIEREEQRTNNEPEEYIYVPKLETWHSPKATELLFNRYAYNRCLQKMNKLELEYAKVQDSDEEVLFWYKNGDSGKDNFSIAYEGGNFFPDFIVKYKDGSIKLGETKGKPFHIEAKRTALTEYGIKHGFKTEYILE